MKLIKIRLPQEDRASKKELMELLHNQFQKITRKGIGYELSSLEDDDEIQINCRFWSQSEYTMEIFEAISSSTSQAIACFIADLKENAILEEMLCGEYGFQDKAERQEILEFIQFILNTDEQGEDWAEARKMKLKEKIVGKVEEYLLAENEISLQGFIRFRLKELSEEWRSAIEHAIDEYLMDKEYKEFIQLLRYFLSEKENEEGLLHLLHIDDRNIWLFNENWERLYPYLTNGLSVEIAGRKMSYEDLLLSVLISKAPSELMVHTNHENHYIIHTIKKLFEANIKICSQCPQCEERINQVRLADSSTYR